MIAGAVTGMVKWWRMTGVTVVALSVALVMGACGGSDPAPSDAQVGAATLSAIRSEIFNETCVVGGCHTGSAPAAMLDLRSDSVCSSLVGHKSCLFPDRVLVIPGKPEASFLMNKLRGTGLDGTPDPACATSNDRMPSAQTPLPDSKIAQIENWIRAGANCDGAPPIDAGIDAPPEPPADIASVSAGTTTLQVDQQTQVTVTLTHGSPSGQVVIIDIDDSTILEVTNLVTVGQGTSSAMFDVRGKAAGLATLTISSGTNSQSITFMVTPLTRCDDNNAILQLARSLPARSPRDWQLEKL